jgi:hypothetical protein
MNNIRWIISMIISGLITTGLVYLQAVYPATFAFMIYCITISIIVYFLTEVVYSELGRYNIFRRQHE